jgi:hypothetical protein
MHEAFLSRRGAKEIKNKKERIKGRKTRKRREEKRER